jgi:5-methylcytosine-specific restriction protein A
MRAALPCRHHGCPALVARSGYCPSHQKAVYHRQDQQRGSAASRGYGAKWQAARKGYLAAHPLCVDCMEQGRVTAATELDHIIPHRGDMALFWDRFNWAGRCKAHHSAKTMRESVRPS